MEFVFCSDPAGAIGVATNVGELLTHALNDSISSLAPRGAAHPGLSTYWIDHAEAAVRARAGEGTAAPFASGNVTYLRLAGDRVIAGYEFDEDESQAATITVDDFLKLLDAWRAHVIAAGGVSGADAAKLAPDAQPRPIGPSAP